MKIINLYLEDQEYEKLQEVKGNLTWKEFVMSLIKKEVKENGMES